MNAAPALVLVLLVPGAAALADPQGDVHRFDHTRTPPQDVGRIDSPPTDIVDVALRAAEGGDVEVALTLAAPAEASPVFATTYTVQLATGREAGAVHLLLARTSASQTVGASLQELGAEPRALEVRFAQENATLTWTLSRARLPADLPCFAVYKATSTRQVARNGSIMLQDRAPEEDAQVCGGLDAPQEVPAQGETPAAAATSAKRTPAPSALAPLGLALVLAPRRRGRP